MRGDGAGWVDCPCGGRHWGLHGAAGLLLLAPAHGGERSTVLLQHRAPWSHQGQTWGLPGGAIDSHETPLDGALRETFEETGIPAGSVAIHSEHLVDHGPWSYRTFVGTCATRLPVVACAESLELAWVPWSAAGLLDLHPALRSAWPELSALVERVVAT